jgi:hypothetical protein
MAKQTAGNNKLLAEVKKTFNEKIYKHFSKIVNEEGSDKALDYLMNFFKEGIREEKRKYYNSFLAN